MFFLPATLLHLAAEPGEGLESTQNPQRSLERPGLWRVKCKMSNTGNKPPRDIYLLGNNGKQLPVPKALES